MGQRQQIYIKIDNPAKYSRLWDEKEKKKLRALFGNGKYTIVALHHQWLYGRSSVATLIDLLNVTNKETMGDSNPFNTETMIRTADSFANELMMMIQVSRCPLAPRGIGIEHMILLNIDEPIHRTDFRQGDNNDGIMIIDSIERKYCFMNTWKKTNHRASKLQPMKPSTAKQYMKCYYGETINQLTEYDTEGKDVSELTELINDNKKGNKELNDLLNESNVTLLTEKELKKMFPKVYTKVLA